MIRVYTAPIVTGMQNVKPLRVLFFVYLPRYAVSWMILESSVTSSLCSLPFPTPRNWILFDVSPEIGNVYFKGEFSLWFHALIVPRIVKRANET